MLNKFDETLKNYLLETPWFNIPLDVTIDLEFEKVKSKDAILNRLYDIIINPANKLYTKDNLSKFIEEITEDATFNLYSYFFY